MKNCQFCKDPNNQTWCGKIIGPIYGRVWICSRERGHLGIHVGCQCTPSGLAFMKHVIIFTNELLTFDLKL